MSAGEEMGRGAGKEQRHCAEQGTDKGNSMGKTQAEFAGPIEGRGHSASGKRAAETASRERREGALADLLLGSSRAGSAFGAEAAPWWEISGRPNEEGKAWLRQALSDAERFGRPWTGRPGLETLEAAAALRLEALLMREARSRGTLSLEDGRRRARALAELPIFFPEAFCRWWEAGRPWAASGFPLGRDAVSALTAAAESGRPSAAYALDGGAAAEAFAGLIAFGRFEPLAEALESSARRLAAGFAASKEPAPLAALAAAASELGLSSGAMEAWALWRLRCSEGSRFKAAFETAMSDMGFCQEKAFARALAAAGIGPEAAQAWADPTFGPEGLGLRRAWPQEGKAGMSLAELCPDPESLRLEGSLLSEGRLSGYPAFDPEPEAKGSWGWIEGFDGAAKALSGKGASVLILGPGGSGKGDLASALAEAAGKRAVRKKEGSGRAGLERALRWAGALGWTVLEEGPIDGAGTASELAERRGAGLVWRCEAGEGFSAGREARAFGFHFSIGDLPPEQRRACALSLFADPTTALRVSRAARLPGEMAALAKAMRQAGTEDWSWAWRWLGARSKALESSKGVYGQAPLVEAKAPDRSIAGCPELSDLLERAQAAVDDPDGSGGFKGVLLMGPPGTGKTMFARALAARCGARTLAPNTSELAEDPSRIVRVFEQARALAPCVLVLDEADALVADPRTPFGVDAKRQARVNALISQMDGVEPLEGVFVVATSHRDFVPDAAATRAGRLSETLRIGLPDRIGRKEIWAEALGPGAASEAELDELARASAGFSGAEIAEAVSRAAAAGRKGMSADGEAAGGSAMKALLAECDRLFWGAASGMRISESERKATAVHEAGHAFAAWGAGLDVVRACARPGGDGFLGMVHFEREDGRASMTPSEWRGRIAVCLAGLAAEKAAFGAFSNGGGSDLEQASRLVGSALRRWGWSSRGPSALPEPSEMSESAKAWLEEESAGISKKVFASTLAWLEERLPELLAFAEELAERRELGGPDLAPWKAQALAAGPLRVSEPEEPEGSAAAPFGQEWDERPFATLHREGA